MKRTAICFLLLLSLFTSQLYADDNFPSVVKADCRPDDCQCLSPNEFEDARLERMNEGLLLVAVVIFSANNPPRLSRFKRHYGAHFSDVTSIIARSVLTIGGFGAAIYSFYSAYSPSCYEGIAKYGLCKKGARIRNAPKRAASKMEPQCPLIPGNSSLTL